MDCIFCKIASKEIPSKLVYEDSKVVAFEDISPAAPVHILIIPKEHITSALDLNSTNIDIVSHIYEVAATLAKDFKIDKGGFRIVNNCGDDGGQTVKHLHFHLLGGRSMQWPPG